MNSIILDKFLENTYTMTDATRRLRVLRAYLELHLYHSNKNILATLNPSDLEWLKALGDDFTNNFTSKNLDELITFLKSSISSINPFTIYIPFELPIEEKAILADKLRKDYGKNFLIEVKMNPNLIGGCSFVWKGIYKDYSLKKKIDGQKKQILSIMKEYIK